MALALRLVHDGFVCYTDPLSQGTAAANLCYANRTPGNMYTVTIFVA
jgi:hypothetical protein